MIGTPLLSAESNAGCPHGDLSARFCDRDGDMLADAESDPGKWIDPYTLIFGYCENLELHDDAQKALGDYLAKNTGKNIRFFKYKTNAAQLEAIRNGLLHIVKPQHRLCSAWSPMFRLQAFWHGRQS